MTYSDIIKAITKITNGGQCPPARKQKLEIIQKNIMKMSPDIQANGGVVNDFMTQAGYIGK